MTAAPVADTPDTADSPDTADVTRPYTYPIVDRAAHVDTFMGTGGGNGLGTFSPETSPTAASCCSPTVVECEHTTSAPSFTEGDRANAEPENATGSKRVLRRGGVSRGGGGKGPGHRVGGGTATVVA